MSRILGVFGVWVILGFLVQNVTASECPVFKCGKIKNQKDEHTCLQYSSEWIVQKCPKGEYCLGDKFNSVESVVNNTLCAKQEVKDRLPGEHCSKDTECYNQFKCHKGTCQGLVTDQRCINQFGREEQRYCSPGLFCDSVKQTCKEITKFGETCTAQAPCEYGTLCAMTKQDAGFSCKKMFSLQDGELVDLTQVFPISTVAYSKEDICQSGHVLRSDKGTYCMPGPQLIDSKRVKEKGAGEVCKYKAFRNPNDLTEYQEFTEYSKCGFNTNGSGYCDVYKGDIEYTSAIEGYKEALQKVDNDCHLLSTLSKCKNLKNKEGKAAKKWEQAQFYIGEGSYAAAADNDKCVKSEIMRSFWEGDSSYQLTVTVFLSILALSNLI
ncbi:unnamed protein product [Moneuplotes crassus]|uniref:Uncharacterized protein n=1 Tax=Euplotes crassus TaxID=5936 RepID=A0AAD1XHN3_EUPCR|nr:unnamed protein product [Moneuplotes crassus]